MINVRETPVRLVASDRIGDQVIRLTYVPGKEELNKQHLEVAAVPLGNLKI